MNKDKVLGLAKLARIDISDAEAEKLSGEFEQILNYVGEVQSISSAKNVSQNYSNYPLKNVMREDGEPHESGIYTEDILKNAPAVKDNYLKVKKIL